MSLKAAKSGKLVSIDLKKMEPIGNSIQIQGDFTEEKTQVRSPTGVSAGVSR